MVAAGLVARARAITEGQLPLPARREAIAIAGAIEASGLREGAGARAVVLDSTAAGLFARLWRAEGREEDATKAIKLYRAASRDVDIPGACEAASAGAHLVGEVTADRAAEYRELYRVSRLFGHGPVGDGGVLHCQRSVEDDLAELVAFRPPTGVLAAIDDRLAVEGAIVLDRDAPRSNVGAPRITRVESWPGIEASRVVVELDRPATYRVAD